MKTKFYQSIPFFIFLFPFVFVQYTNTKIDDIGNPEEVSIVGSILNTNQLVAGANLKYTYNSVDTGLTWTKQIATSAFGIYWISKQKVGKNSRQRITTTFRPHARSILCPAYAP